MVENYNQHNLVNFSNSVLKHYGVARFHETEQAIDEALGRKIQGRITRAAFGRPFFALPAAGKRRKEGLYSASGE